MQTPPTGIELALRAARRLLSTPSSAAEGIELVYRLRQIVERYEGDADALLRAKQELRLAEQEI
jgi:hypothetical protein